jgi:hypothetical protein
MSRKFQEMQFEAKLHKRKTVNSGRLCQVKLIFIRSVPNRFRLIEVVYIVIYTVGASINVIR